MKQRLRRAFLLCYYSSMYLYAFAFSKGATILSEVQRTLRPEYIQSWFRGRPLYFIVPVEINATTDKTMYYCDATRGRKHHAHVLKPGTGRQNFHHGRARDVRVRRAKPRYQNNVLYEYISGVSRVRSIKHYHAVASRLVPDKQYW